MKPDMVVGSTHGQPAFGHPLPAGEGQGQVVLVDIGLRRVSMTLGDHSKPASIECIVGNTIRRVRIWTEEEWAEVDPVERPSCAERFLGHAWIAGELGWKRD
jgi:hypothetical protein